jgi:hypothetical protein
MRLLPALALLPILTLPACADLGGVIPIAAVLVGQQVSVKAPDELPFPDLVTLKLDPNASTAARLGNSVLGALGQTSLEDKLGQVLKAQTTELRRQGAAAFKQELIESKLFGHVVDSGENVSFSLGVSRFGLSWSPATQSYQLVLDLEAKLIEPHVGTVWSGVRSMKDLSADTKALATKVDVVKLIADAGSFHGLVQASTKELSLQLLDDLRRNPPMSRLGAKQ